MAEEPADSASKTEEATPRKLEEARKKGDVAKSQDLASWATLAAVSAYRAGGGRPDVAATSPKAWLVFLSAPHGMISSLETGNGVDVARRAVLIGAPAVGAIMLAAALAGTFGNVVQTGLLWTTGKMAPSFNKISPMAGFKRIYGIDGLAQFVKTLIKLTITAWVAWRVLQPHRDEMASGRHASGQRRSCRSRSTLLVALTEFGAHLFRRHRRLRLDLAASTLPDPHENVPRRTEGGHEASGGRSADQGAAAPDPHHARAQTDDGPGAQGDPGDHQPHPLRGGLALCGGGDAGADLPGQGHGRYRAEDPGDRGPTRDPHRRRSAAGARAVRHGGDRRRHPARPLRSGGQGHRLHHDRQGPAPPTPARRPRAESSR